MTLRELLEKIGNDYPSAIEQNFAAHPLAELIRKRPKEVLGPLVHEKSFAIQGSAGQGQWAKIPWIAIYDKSTTDGVQEGLYIGYLFSEDGRRVYLILGLGTQGPINRVGRRYAFDEFYGQVANYRREYEFPGFVCEDGIRIAEGGLGADYEKAIICFKLYELAELPSYDALEKDFSDLLSKYIEIIEDERVLFEGTHFDRQVEGVEEGKRHLKQHYVRERNRKIISKAKEEWKADGGELLCEVCGFNFTKMYGDRGSGYIEAHHKKAVSEMEAGDVTTVRDLARLCSNCHRMIHRTYPYISVGELKSLLQTHF